ALLRGVDPVEPELLRSAVVEHGDRVAIGDPDDATVELGSGAGGAREEAGQEQGHAGDLDHRRMDTPLTPRVSDARHPAPAYGVAARLERLSVTRPWRRAAGASPRGPSSFAVCGRQGHGRA